MAADVISIKEPTGIFKDKRIIDQGDGTIVVDLKSPIKSDKGDIPELTFREPTVGDLESADAITGDVGKQRMIIASVTGVSVVLLKKLGMADYARCGRVLMHYTGNEPSESEDGSGT